MEMIEKSMMKYLIRRRRIKIHTSFGGNSKSTFPMERLDCSPAYLEGIGISWMYAPSRYNWESMEISKKYDLSIC
jgi:hypothetical protein